MYSKDKLQNNMDDIPLWSVKSPIYKSKMAGIGRKYQDYRYFF